MQLSVMQIILIFIFSCICGAGSVLDEFQTHRPLIACTIVGLICGDITKGIILGGTLELIALGWMNIGAAQSPDSALASVISTILVVVGNQGIQQGIAIALPVAAAGQVLTAVARTITIAFQHAANKAAEDAKFNQIVALHFSALFVQALRVAIPATMVAAVVDANVVSSMLSQIPEVITGGLSVAGGIIVIVGYAMVMNMMNIKYLMPFFFLGFILGGYLDFSLLAFGGMGLIFAIIYVELNPNFANSKLVAAAHGPAADDELDDELED